ncbi:TIGR03773 family transporter-associated surface protein [Arthrobacter russicus]|uniref:Surface-anchored protein n=1 Tax=Arthrobacter russicus TaxID=172040 RepID=A0ABU1JBM9_9MICC|nr:TIGR03773 family transporter-associated surface protein [Arthrobacter russicus]MDR6269820.1 surface-anchored protein [Arthrobacter russicus]
MKIRSALLASLLLIGAAVVPGQLAAAVSARADSPPPTVIDSGYAQIAPLAKAFDGNPGRVESFRAGIALTQGAWSDADGGKDFSKQTFIPAEQAILHLAAADRLPQGGFGTPATENYLAAGTVLGSAETGSEYSGSGRLLIGAGTLVSRGAGKPSSELNARGESTRDFTGTNAANVFALLEASTPAGGKAVLTGKGATGPVSLDSSLLNGSAPGGSEPALFGVTSSLSTEFTVPGRYCLTISQALKTKQGGMLTASGRYTVYVGDLPAKPLSCATGNPDPGNPDPGNPDPGDPAKPATVVRAGHLDVRAPLSGDGKSLQLQIANSQQRVPFQDLVLTGVRSGSVPTPDPGRDFSVVGAPGSKYWYFGQGEPDPEHYVWPGFSGEDFSPSDLAFGFQDATLTEVSGPAGGNFAMFYDDAVADRLRPDAVYFDTRQGMPQSLPIAAASHKHFTWSFTQPGKYCLAFQAKALRSAGDWVRDSAQLTIWVGDPGQAAAQVPCDRVGGTAGLSLLSHDRAAPNQAPVGPVLRSGMLRLEPTVDVKSGGLNARYQAASNLPARDAAPGELVVSATLYSGGKYLIDANDSESSPALVFDSGRIAPGALSGLLTVSFGQVQGPGTVQLLNGSSALLSSNPADSLGQTLFAGQSRADGWRWSFDQPGVYCVPLTIDAQPLGSVQPVRSSSMLTFAVGSETPGTPGYLDRSAIKPCADGGSASKPGDVAKPGKQPGGADRPTGVSVLAEGHIDLASRLGAHGLRTEIKDSSQGQVVYRDPAKTVLQAKNPAKRTIRGGSSFGFLGAPGSEVYVLGQTQEPGLLWPGWSTEEVPQLGAIDWTLTRLGTVGAGPAPGDFAMYQLGELAQPEIKFNSAAGINRFTIPAGVHQHGSWVFSAPGVYCTAFQRSAADGQSSDFTVAWVVGEEVDPGTVDPARCFDGEQVHGLPDQIKSAAEAPGHVPTGNRTAPAPVCPVPGAGSSTGPAPGSAVLDQGHVDFASRLVDGKFRSQIKDGTTGAVTWHEPGSTVIKVKPEAAISAPGGAFGFLGPAGTTVYQIPQTQRPGLVWLGWNTESLAPQEVSGPVDWSLDAVSGPGQVHVFELSAFGSPIPVLDAGGSYRIPLNTHAHGNWSFSAPGLYRLTMTQRAVLASGQSVSDTQVLTVQVGEPTPAADAGAAPCAAAVPAAAASPVPADGAPGSGMNAAALPVDGASGAGWPAWVWGLIMGGVLLLGTGLGTGGAFWVLRKR